MAALEAKVDKLFDLFRHGADDKGSEEQPGERSIAAEVANELAKLRAAEDAARATAERDAKVDELSAKVAAVPERRPREYRRATQAMGWATEADK
jgi:hypothetical protein